jgi:hypothetical protein
MRPRRSVLPAAILLWLLPWGLMPAAAQPVAPTADEVKAAYLLNFIRFIEWPAATMEADAHFTICLLGQITFHAALEQVLAGETFKGRRIEVRQQRRFASSCQVLYVGPAERDVAPLLRAVGRGVLTVGEGEGFLNAGGMISLVTENRRIRFDINHSLATERGLTISSRLLRVARQVRGLGR